MSVRLKSISDILKELNITKSFEDMTAEELADVQGVEIKNLKEVITDLQEKASNSTSNDDVAKQIADVEKQINEKTQKQIATMLEVSAKNSKAVQELLKKSQTNTFEVLSPFEKSIEDNMEVIKKGASQGHSTANEFVVKANFVAGSVANNTDALRLNTIGQLEHRALTMWDAFPKFPVPRDANGTVRYSDWDEATKVRAADMIAEGGTFPESTAAFAEYSITLKKVGDTIPVTEESLYDRARFTAELQMFLTTNVNLIVDNQVMNGDGTGNNASGIYTTAQTYSAPNAGIDDASIYDLIVKLSEQMTKGKDSKIMPNVAFMNITDINKMKLKKDANNNYIMPPFKNGDNMVDNILIIPTNTLTENTMVMADNRFVRIYEEPGFTVSTGLVGDQFKQDLITMKARRRFEVLVRQADRQAVYKVTDISAALTALATP